MLLPQLLTKFGLTLPRLEAILGQHIELPNLRLVRQVPPEWETILARELGVSADAGAVFGTVAEELAAWDAKQEALATDLVLPTPAAEGRDATKSPTAATGLKGLKVLERIGMDPSVRPSVIGTEQLASRAVAKNTGLTVDSRENSGKNFGKNQPVAQAPDDATLQFGKLVDVVDDRYGKVCKLGSTARVHLPLKAIRTLPVVGEWLLFAERPDDKNPVLSTVYWARPLSYDLVLLKRVLALSEWATLHLLLDAKLDGNSREFLMDAFLARQEPAVDADTLANVRRNIELAGKKGIPVQEGWLDGLVGRSMPEFAWQLWVRYGSPLAVWPDVAERVIRLLETTPEVATDWWAGPRSEGLSGLYLAYIATAGPVSLLKAWQGLKTALGAAQATVYHEMLRQWLKSLFPVEGADSYVLYLSVVRTTVGDKASLEQELAGLLAPPARLEVWLAGEGIAFPQAWALARFEGLSVADQDKVVAHLPDDNLPALSQFIVAEHAAATRQRARRVLDDGVRHRFVALGLDLESNRETIHEIAWGSPGVWHVGQGPEAVAVVLAALGERTAGPAYLIVGHNVRDFDAPILAEQGVTLPADCLWDTLLVEMALSPARLTYALQTAHTAAADAELALRLFGNQVLRLGQLAEARWEALRPLFAAPVQGLLADFRRTFAAGWLQPGELDLEAAACLRPRSAPSGLRRQVQEWLAAAPSGAVLVAPREVWAEALSHSPVRFWADEDTVLDYRELQPAAVLQRAEKHPTEQVLLDGFFELCRREGWPALLANMAPALRARLRAAKIDLADCLAPLPERLDTEAAAWCLTVEQLRTIGPAWPEPGPRLVVVEPDLITLSNRHELRRLGADEVRHNAATNTEWLKFSGGQSFLGLTPAQARQLGANPTPGYDNFWLEKHQYGQYRLWAGFGWEQRVAELAGPGQPVTYLSGAARDYPAGQLRSAAAPAQRLQRQLGVVPLNPETIYRSRYWLLQAALVSGLAERGSRPAPLVLLVQRPEEVGPLEKYFGREGLGFYVPAAGAQLARRLELLHQSGQAKRLLVLPVGQAAALFEGNYLGPLRVVLESFNLLENFYLAHGSRLFDAARQVMDQQLANQAGADDADDEADDESERVGEGGENRPPEDRPQKSDLGVLETDLLFLLELQRPVVFRLQALLADNDPESQLWLLDPRLSDFAGLAQAWRFGRETVEVPWQSRADYDEAAALADRHLGGVRPDTDLALDTDQERGQAQDLLRQIFLRDDADPDQVRFHDWRPNQLPCLAEILPARTNLVVTLATGGGKSVLFQAPALYRSSFTNRLSVVVTPLRALMEDQVSKLWELGFYSSVEYINSDKQDELNQIYRRLAGGEIQLLFITPERFRSNAFANAFAQRFDLDGGLEYAVFDEAHCISQWGHEFRPDYLHAARQVQRLRQEAHERFGRRFPVLLFSATVTEKILAHFNVLFPEDEITR